ncbi:meiosis-specific protein ASY2-like [Brassica rapa]|uniref:meiosis-specific protein ASY2-like n=1 Tax=Brassica campestris TaxID=3711 RepID=UPI00142DEFEE|nr:meiosis-specific protein ASY2-like [Brassica rapa]
MPMSVRSFEEMTSITDMKDGTYSVKMRLKCNVCAGHPNKTQNWQRSYFFLKSDSSAFEKPPRNDYRVLWNRSCVGHPTSPVYPEDFLRSVRAVALLRVYRWSEITVKKIHELKDRIARREWRSDLPTVLPIRAKRLDIFPRDIQKQISEAKKMGTLPDLSAMIAAQLGLVSGEGPSTAVPRAGEVPPYEARGAGKGRKRKRGDGSGAERSTEEASDVPPSGEPQKKKKKKRTKKKSVSEESGNLEGPTETEGGDVEEEGLHPEEEALAAGALGEEDDEEEAVDGQEPEASLGDAGSDNLEEESEGSPLLIRRRDDEADGEEQFPAPISPYVEVPARPSIGAVQTGTSSRGDAILRRVPGVSFPDKVDFHYEGPAPLAYVPEKCGELLRQFRGRAKPLPAVKDLIFGGEYEEAARAKLLGDSAMNVLIDKYNTALKGALGELELAKKEFAEKEEVLARQLSEKRSNLEKLNGMMSRTITRRDELKAELEASRGVVRELEQKNADLESEKVSLTAAHEREMKRLRDSRILEVTKERVRVETEMAAKANRRFARIRSEKSDEASMMKLALRRAGSDISQATIEIFAEQERKYEQEAEKLKVGEIPAGDLALSPLVLDSQFVDARILASLDPYGSNAGLIDPETALTLHTPLTHSTEGETPNRGNLAAEDNAPLLVLSDTSAEGSRRGNEEENVGVFEEIPRSDEMHVSPAARESSVRASELSALNDRESDRED